MCRVLAAVVLIARLSCCKADELPRPLADDQPLASNATRLISALEYLGAPLPTATVGELRTHIAAQDSVLLQKTLDRFVLCAVSINPELRVKVARGPADPILQQSGFTPVLVKVLNEATVTRRLQISSPQAGPIYSGASQQILQRQAQTELNINENVNRERRFLDVEIFESSPMTSRLSGLAVEYVIALIHANESGQREAIISFDIGQGTQDLGFRSEVPILFSIRPAMSVKLAITDFDGSPTTARLEFRDRDGRVYPAQAKRLAPDFFFQPQIYRKHGDRVLLPPGTFEMTSSRGPEYRRVVQSVKVEPVADNVIDVQLKRWVDPEKFGFYSGDHHIHAAGCSHYDNPTQGVSPQDMFAQVKGEGLNVGCVLTWGPCFDHQRNFFSPIADTVSEDKTVLKYDLEISGFGSAALGHVCLLNLKDQTYPGSDGTASKGWPSWTVPVMRWARQQGGITGYPHSALEVDPKLAADWQLRTLDSDSSGGLSRAEVDQHLLAEEFTTTDENGDGQLSAQELTASADRCADILPNYALPSLNGGGAMEIFVASTEGVCDFISAMDTARVPEWNTWYHLMNCGFPMKLSGETDFPCMSSRRVGQGRVYVQLGNVKKVEFPEWCRGLAEGRSYVSDGFAHALHFSVNGITPGSEVVQMTDSGVAKLKAKVAFAAEQPKGVAYGTLEAAVGNRIVGDTINLHAERETGYVDGGVRLIEIIRNGEVVASRRVEADGSVHEIDFDIPITESCWLAVRQFPQLHTNPVYVKVADKEMTPVHKSALWCAESVRLLWHNRSRFINESERTDARQAYENALTKYLDLAEKTGQQVRRFPLSR